jgi:hypothetical protein
VFTKRRIFFSSTICSAMFVKKKYTFYTIKSSLKLAYYVESQLRIKRVIDNDLIDV